MRKLLLVSLLVFVLTGCTSGEDAYVLGAGEPCPVSPVVEGFWDGTGDVAGEFPFWMSHVPTSKWSDFEGGTSYVPGPDSGLDFERGYSVKRLVFVSKNIEGDLMVTGRRLDGPGQLYFIERDDQFTQLNADTYQIDAPLATQQTYVDAQVAEFSPNPPDAASHPGGYMITGPGCYELEATIQDYSVKIVFDVLDE